MDEAHGQAEPRCSRLERGQQLAVESNPFGQAVKALRRAVGPQQARCQSSKAGRGAGTAPSLRMLALHPAAHGRELALASRPASVPQAQLCTLQAACRLLGEVGVG
jgi:hypothetical protein